MKQDQPSQIRRQYNNNTKEDSIYVRSIQPIANLTKVFTTMLSAIYTSFENTTYAVLSGLSTAAVLTIGPLYRTFKHIKQQKKEKRIPLNLGLEDTLQIQDEENFPISDR